MRISDWSSDVCSSDLAALPVHFVDEGDDRHVAQPTYLEQLARLRLDALGGVDHHHRGVHRRQRAIGVLGKILVPRRVEQVRSEEHTSELQSLMRNSYAVFCLTKKTQQQYKDVTTT